MPALYYRLVGKRPVPAQTLAEAFPSDPCYVARTEHGGVLVSTVFLALNHNFFGLEGPAILFETCVFGGDHDGVTARYATWDEAARGHAEFVRALIPEALLPVPSRYAREDPL